MLIIWLPLATQPDHGAATRREPSVYNLRLATCHNKRNPFPIFWGCQSQGAAHSLAFKRWKSFKAWCDKLTSRLWRLLWSDYLPFHSLSDV